MMAAKDGAACLMMKHDSPYDPQNERGYNKRVDKKRKKSQ
jgi:hypothetical protein